MATNAPVWETVDMEKDISATQYVRLHVDPASGQMVVPPRVCSTRAPEFPVVPSDLAMRKHRYAYTVGTHKEFELRDKGTGAAGAILKIDAEDPSQTEAFSFEPHEFVGEPMFVPKVGADVRDTEDRGYVVCHVLNGRDLTTDLVILDVEGKGSLERGPVSRVRLPTFVPHGLHGIWEENAVFDF